MEILYRDGVDKHICHKRIPVPHGGELGWPSHASSGSRPGEVCENKSYQKARSEQRRLTTAYWPGGLMLFIRLETHERVATRSKISV